MSAAAGRHPSDAERERAALPVLTEALRAARARDARALSACYDDEAVWLDGHGCVRGGAEAAARHAAIAEEAASWDEPQQQGAKAVLRWTPAGPGAGPRALVVEVRRGRIVFAASA